MTIFHIITQHDFIIFSQKSAILLLNDRFFEKNFKELSEMERRGKGTPLGAAGENFLLLKAPIL